MAKLSAKTTITITTDVLNVKSSLTATEYRVGNCKLTDSDLDALIPFHRSWQSL